MANCDYDHIESLSDEMVALLEREKELRQAARHHYRCDLSDAAFCPSHCQFGLHPCRPGLCPLSDELDAGEYGAMARDIFEVICQLEEAAEPGPVEVPTLE